MSTTISSYRDEQIWREARKHGIGGSEVAAIFGLHPFVTAHEVWLEKVGRAAPRVETPDMRRGKRLEPIAADLYVERTGRKVRRQPMRRHAEFPHLLASIDRQIIAGDGAAGQKHNTGALEIKVPRTWNFMRIKREGVTDYIVLQGVHEALVWGYDYTAFGIYSPDDDDLLTWDVPFSADLAQRIIEVCSDWWHEHIELGREPSRDATVADLKDLPEVTGEVRYRTDQEWRAAAREFFEARELVKEAESIKKSAQEQIKRLAGGYGVFEERDQNRFYLRAMPGRKTFDKDALAAIKPVDPLAIAGEMINLGIQADIASAAVQKCFLDLERFNKTGKAFETLTGYLLSPLDG